MEIDLLNKRTRETEFAFKQSNIYNYNTGSCSETHLLYFSEHIIMCAKKIEIMWWNPQNPHSIQVQSARLLP